MTVRIPFLRPHPPELSRLVQEIKAIERSGIFSNYGPVNTRLERAMTEVIFGGAGGCLTVNCATTGLMMAIREAADLAGGGKYALMPSFTFAATAHAAIWAGLTPLLCDIEPDTWAPSATSEERLLKAYAGQVGCIVPYAPFGNCIDLDRYTALAREHHVGIVIDAAASLGSLDERGRGFGADFSYAVVFSMHATKVFATTEGGVIHCGDPDRLARLRAMGNFGFAQPRIASMPGLNSKLSEIGALMALARLDTFDKVVAARDELADAYRSRLRNFTFQRRVGLRQAHVFMPTLLPVEWAANRKNVVAAMARRGIGVAHYFSPHLAEHPFFANVSTCDELTVTQEIADRSLSLPMFDTMTLEEVDQVCTALAEVMGVDV